MCQHHHVASIGRGNSDVRNISCRFRVEGVWHTQYLLYTRHRITRTSGGVNLGFQIIGTIAPVDIFKTALQGIAPTYLNGKQTVNICSRSMCFLIHRVTRRRALQDSHTHTHISIGYEVIGRITHYRLESEFLRCLRKSTCYKKQ